MLLGPWSNSDDPTKALLGLVCGAPFVLIGVILFMTGVGRTWTLLVFRYGLKYQPCDFAGACIIVGANMVLGLSLAWLGSLVYQVIASRRAPSPTAWASVTSLLFVTLMTPLVYRLLFGAGCAISN